MVEYIVAIDVTRVRFPADALSLLLFVLCDFVPTRRKEPLSRGYGATVARLTPDQTVGRSNRSGLILGFQRNILKFIKKYTGELNPII